MPIDLYYMRCSPPSNLVLLAARQLDVELNLIYTDLMKGEHLAPEFVKVSYTTKIYYYNY